jgi:hypothetical protein
LRVRGLRLGSGWADELEELVLGDLQVFRELFGRQAAGHRLHQRVALGLEKVEGAAVVFFEGAGPGLCRLFRGLFERFAFKDEGGELGRPVGRRGEAALGPDEADGRVQADGVAEEVGDVAGLFGRDLEPDAVCLRHGQRGFSSARPSRESSFGGRAEKARSPVMAWPTIRVFTSFVPS